MEVYDESTQTGFVKPYDNFICRLNLFFYNNPYNIYTEMKSLTHYYNKANNYYNTPTKLDSSNADIHSLIKYSSIFVDLKYYIMAIYIMIALSVFIGVNVIPFIYYEMYTWLYITLIVDAIIGKLILLIILICYYVTTSQLQNIKSIVDRYGVYRI